jgi:hypothetical protein
MSSSTPTWRELARSYFSELASIFGVGFGLAVLFALTLPWGQHSIARRLGIVGLVLSLWVATLITITTRRWFRVRIAQRRADRKSAVSLIFGEWAFYLIGVPVMVVALMGVVVALLE